MKYLVLFIALVYIYYAMVAKSTILVLVSNTIHHCNAHVFIDKNIVAVCKFNIVASSRFKIQYLGE
jgi:hypothetical protein